MKQSLKTRFLALFICIALLLASLPITAFAEEADTVLSMTEGDVIPDFAPAGSACVTSDASVAWVDDKGTLNALKPGTVTISVPAEEGSVDYTVTVEDYTDGSDVVGNLKILARFNDSMPFYDGHVYLLFTSYQDGVEITVPDLYAGYELSEQYYKDIKEDISNGSNHTGSNVDDYFTFDNEMSTMTLDRGEIVTIGMYRGFDLSVPQTMLGALQNSSGWNSLNAEVKTQIINILFKYLQTGEDISEQAFVEIKAVLDEIGADYNKVIDGVVEGGVCFNRELYNQKLEWDQYENVTYEMDVTRNQLGTLTMYLGGNLNHFSILKNSCATVAVRAWNAAVGTRNGQPGAYYLSAAGEGVFSVVDAPKSVRDSIEYRLPGYYLNNSEDVAEPDAGYRDDTGWVYVSAPEKVTPVSYTYENDPIRIDADLTKVSTLINAAKAGQLISYNKDAQEIGVNVKTDVQGDLITVSGIDFTVNGTTVSIDGDNLPEVGCWFTMPVDAPAQGEDYRVFDPDGEELPGYYSDGMLKVYAENLPLTFRYVTEPIPEDQPGLFVSICGDMDTDITTEVYRKDGEDVIMLGDVQDLDEGTKVFVRSAIPETDDSHILSDIIFEGESILDSAHYDAEEEAYFVIIPKGYASLSIFYNEAEVSAKGSAALQLAVGETVDVHDCATLDVGGIESIRLVWKTLIDSDGALEVDGANLKAVKEGSAVVLACAESNMNVYTMFVVEVYDDTGDMAAITYDDSLKTNALITVKYGEETSYPLFSGYKVKKGSVLSITPLPEKGKALLYLYADGKLLKPGEEVTVTDDTEIKAKFVDEIINGMPNQVKLAEQGDTYQLEAKVSYTGLYQLLPVFDDSITYQSSDEDLVTVDENGLITVTGDVPEDGKIVVVTAYAGSTMRGVSAVAKVYVGDYKGGYIVGRLTISARPATKNEQVSHGALTFTTYEDLDMPVSFYHYYQPNENYSALMADYRDNPENYTSDPALYSDNELNLEDRESYFTVIANGAESAPQNISLRAGESITISNYGFETANLTSILKVLEDSTISYSPQTQTLIRQIKAYLNDEEYDGAAAFDSLVSTLVQIYVITQLTGQTPANGRTDGGLCVNRELYGQFVRSDSQTPNHYYTVEITADELELLKAYLADPENNVYSLLAMNCATRVVDIWDAVLADYPELQLTGNYTGVTVDPESLYIELGLLRAKQLIEDIPGEGGTDFYPRSVAYSDAYRDVIAKIDAIGDVDATDECRQRIDDARDSFDALSDSEKALVRNIDDLIAAEEEYARLTAVSDKEAFAAYKQEKLAAVDALARDDDGVGIKLIIAAARGVIAALEYDDAKSLEENKAVIDAAYTLLEQTLKTLRGSDPVKEDILLGDADGDGAVTIYDVSAIQKKLADMPVDPFSEEAADVDGDGILTIFDATILQRWLAGIPGYDEIGKPINSGTPDPTDAPVDPAADVAEMKTIAQVLAAYPGIPYSFGSDEFRTIVETEDHIYLITATVTEELNDAADSLSFDDPQYRQKLIDLFKNTPIASCEDLKPQIIPQEELDQLVGKTGQELLDMGYGISGYTGDEESIVMTLTKGAFEYLFAFNEEVDFTAEDFDEYEAIKTLTVKSAEYSGVNSLIL